MLRIRQKEEDLNHRWLVFIVIFTTLVSSWNLQACGKEQGQSAFIKGTQSVSNALYPIGYTVLSAQYPYKELPITFKIAVWYPTESKPGKHDYQIGSNAISTDATADAAVAQGRFPLLFYSHGATGSGTSSFFICETLARNGYIVVAPDFLDTVSVARIDETVPFDGLIRMRTAQYISSLREFGLNKASSEGRTLYSYRPEQLKQTIELVLAMNKDSDGNLLHGHIDESKIGLFGHSFGAWTSLLLAGAGPLQHDPRIKAVVALSGPVNEHVFAVASPNDLAAVKIPVLFEYGDREKEVGRKDDKTLLFDKANTPKILIAIKDADHLSFSGGVRGEHRLAVDYLDRDPVRKTIADTTLDFFDAYIKGDQAKRDRLKERTEGVAFSVAQF